MSSRIYAWWYFAIAAGFVLLAINRALTGEKTWLIVIRLVIAAGFAALGYAELRSHAARK
jgi:tetrahydromethanopterin S-methyltransferase subunit C